MACPPEDLAGGGRLAYYQATTRPPPNKRSQSLATGGAEGGPQRHRRAVAYCRVSGPAQELALQRSAVEKLAHQRGDAIDEWFEEKVSGKTLKRPELDRLRAA